MTSHYLDKPLRDLIEATLDASEDRRRTLISQGIGIMKGYRDALGSPLHTAEAWIKAAEKELGE
jgi:hypothetical protein